MRKVMVAAMLIVVMLLLYEATAGGEGGIGRSAESRAARAGSGIGSIDP
jgi:hypothetical protein